MSEIQSQKELDLISNKIIGAALEVHKNLGPGLLESTYEKCLCYELEQLGLYYNKQHEVPFLYKGINMDISYRTDLLINNKVIVELKTVDYILPVHEAQLLTYLKLTNLRLGLLINFNVKKLKDGIKRMVNNF